MSTKLREISTVAAQASQDETITVQPRYRAGAVAASFPRRKRKLISSQVRRAVHATAGLTTWDVGLPNTQDFLEYRQVNAPGPKSHPPSLKNPIKVRQPLGLQDGWRIGDTKEARKQALNDLREQLHRLRRSASTMPAVERAAYPVFPSMRQWI